MEAKWELRPLIKITVRNLAGHILEVVEYQNTIKTVALTMLRDALRGSVSDCAIKYMATGDDGTTPIAGPPNTLGNEVFRKLITSFSLPAANKLKTTVYLSPANSVGWIRELGWFCGATAGAGVNTGILLGHVLYSRNKTAVESITVERTDTLEEA